MLWNEEGEVHRGQEQNDHQDCDKPLKDTRWQKAKKSELPRLEDEPAVRAAYSSIKFLQRRRQYETGHTAIRPGSLCWEQ
jgi:hypothetical protein